MKQRLDLENANTRVIAYFDSMTSDRNCFEIHAFQTFVINGLNSGLIEVIDYYSPGWKNFR